MPSLTVAELNVSLLRALGVDPVGVSAAVLTLRAKHPPRVVVTRIVRSDSGVVQQVEALKLQAVADGEGMAPVSPAAALVSMSTGSGS